MLGILLFCFGVMYTPGPVNILSLNFGMRNRLAAHVPFSLGVAVSLCFWFLVIGYTGSAVVGGAVLPVITLLGVGFILYLAWKITAADVQTPVGTRSIDPLSFRDGLLMQLLNPKAFLVVLPVTTVQFPAAGISGGAIALWSVGLGLLGFGAPMAYVGFGRQLARRIENVVLLKYFNLLMGLTLVGVALDMAYEHLYLVLR